MEMEAQEEGCFAWDHTARVQTPAPIPFPLFESHVGTCTGQSCGLKAVQEQSVFPSPAKRPPSLLCPAGSPTPQASVLDHQAGKQGCPTPLGQD